MYGRHPAITEALDRVERAKDTARSVLLECQEDCDHHLAYQQDWRPGVDGFGSRNAVRICALCGYEEWCPYGSVHFKHWPDGGMTAVGLGGRLEHFPRTYNRETRFPADCKVIHQDDAIRHRVLL